MINKKSFFIERAEGRSQERTHLEGDIEVDTLIVGAGIAGTATAYELSRRIDPHKIALVDSGRVGFSTTGQSAGLIVDCMENNYCNTPLDVHREITLGIQGILKTIEKEALDCGLSRTPNLLIARGNREVEEVRKEYAARTAAGFKVRLIERKAAFEEYGLVADLIVEHNAGHCLDPAAFVDNLVKVIERDGVRVFEGTEIKEVDSKTRLAKTQRGNIKYKNIVLATTHPSLNNVPRSRSLLFSSAVALTNPLTQEQYIHGLRGKQFMGWNAPDIGYFYFRPVVNKGEIRILIGGLDKLVSLKGASKVSLSNTDLKKLKKLLVTNFPDLGGTEFSHGWRGVIPSAVDGMSLVGQYKPNHFKCLNGGGLSISYHAGQIMAKTLTREITEIPEQFRHDRKMELLTLARAITKWQPNTLAANLLYFR